MIAFVRGQVIAAGVDHVIVDLGAVGVTLHCTPASAASVRPSERVEFLTSMVVREESWTLYGFLEADERSVFEQVQTVSGIGPRIAMALLATLTPDEMRRAVAAGDEAALMNVPGIGRKGAQRLILELADRLGAPVGSTSRNAAGPPASGWRSSVVAGLTSLGWSAREAEAAVSSLDPALAAGADDDPAAADIAALLKAALRGLDRS